MRRRKPPQQLLKLLDEQLDFLRSSNQSFDLGHEAEAKRIAVSLRVLFHHTGRSSSLFNQLGLQDRLIWLDTASHIDPRNVLPTNGLTSMGSRFGPDGGEIVFMPRLRPSKPVPSVGFEEWWTTPVIKDGDGRLFCRQDLVLALAHSEGGAHVDPRIDEAYAALAESGSLGWFDEVGRVLANPVFPSVRQISYEVLESVEQQRSQVYEDLGES